MKTIDIVISECANSGGDEVWILDCKRCKFHKEIINDCKVVCSLIPHVKRTVSYAFFDEYCKRCNNKEEVCRYDSINKYVDVICKNFSDIVDPCKFESSSLYQGTMIKEYYNYD